MKKTMNPIEILNGKSSSSNSIDKTLFGDGYKVKKIFNKDSLVYGLDSYPKDERTGLSSMMINPIKRKVSSRPISSTLNHLIPKSDNRLSSMMETMKTGTGGNLSSMMIGSRRTSKNPRSQNNIGLSGIMGGRPSKSGNVSSYMIGNGSGIGNIMGVSKKSRPSGLSNMMIRPGRHHPSNILSDTITPNQKRFLTESSGLRKDRFSDTDGDGVIDGLDCFRNNPNEHGIWQKIKNGVTGRGFKDDVDARPRLQPRKISQDRVQSIREEASKDQQVKYETEDEKILKREREKLLVDRFEENNYKNQAHQWKNTSDMYKGAMTEAMKERNYEDFKAEELGEIIDLQTESQKYLDKSDMASLKQSLRTQSNRERHEEVNKDSKERLETHHKKLQEIGSYEELENKKFTKDLIKQNRQHIREENRQAIKEGVVSFGKKQLDNYKEAKKNVAQKKHLRKENFKKTMETLKQKIGDKTPQEFKNLNTYTKDAISNKVTDLRRRAGKSIGYALYDKARRDRYKKEDAENKIQDLRKKLTPKQIEALDKSRKGYDIIKKGILQNKVEPTINNTEYEAELKRQVKLNDRQELASNRHDKISEIEHAAKLRAEPLQKKQEIQQSEYLGYQTALSKHNLLNMKRQERIQANQDREFARRKAQAYVAQQKNSLLQFMGTASSIPDNENRGTYPYAKLSNMSAPRDGYNRPPPRMFMDRSMGVVDVRRDGHMSALDIQGFTGRTRRLI